MMFVVIACSDADDTGQRRGRTLVAGEGTPPPTRGEAAVPAVIDDVVIHPIVAEDTHCSEHAAGGLTALGDALGVDCTIVAYDSGPEGRLASTHDGDGEDNEDFHGWHATLLAPFNGTVDDVYINPVTNDPGHAGEPPASSITFVAADDTHVLYAHVDDVQVEPGDRVTTGQPVAAVGNNGVSYLPHTHVGAWRDNAPLQIRFDLHALGELEAQR